MQIPSAPNTTSLPVQPRASRPDDGIVLPFARSLADTLQENGVADAGFEKVLATMDRLAAERVTERKAAILQDLVGANRWSSGTYVVAAQVMDGARSQRPSLPGPNARPTALQVLDALTSPPRATFTVPAQLEALGYTPDVSRRLLEQQPTVARDLSLWAEADPSQARPRDLYRTMALPGGMAGYDPDHQSREMYFADDASLALSFGRTRVQTNPGTEGVMLHAQVPAFMVETSPPQGWESRWPILRPHNMPDPEHPDLRPYVARLGSFGADSGTVEWHLAQG